MPIGSLTGAALISGGAGLANTLLSSGLQSIGFNQQKSLLAEQQKYYQQNLHDAPVLNAQGLKDAGYSLASEGGAQSVSASSPSAPSSTAFPTTNAFDVGNLLNTYKIESDIALNKANANKAAADADKARGDNSRANAILQPTIDNLRKDLDLKNYNLVNMLPKEREKLESEIKVNTARLDEIEATVSNLKSSTSLNDQQCAYISQKVANFAIEIQEAVSRINANKANAAASYESVRTMQHQQQLIDAEKNLTSAQEGLVNKQKVTEGWRSVEQRSSAILRQFEYEIQKELGVDYYKNRQVILDVLSGTKDVAVSTASAVIATKGIKGMRSGSAGNYISNGFNVTPTPISL